ncbi:fimbrial protein [Kluyvera sp. NPDC087067]|uniref:fimbrial protein n=1 Tax=unclassified Kluyvera TaxID=2619995 RepID=UPI00382F4E8A
MQTKLLTLSLAIISASAMAASSNTVQFRGEVNSQTCSVNINGNPTTPVVLLPTVSTASLGTAQATAGATKFTVNVTGCNSTSAATIKTVFAGNNISSAGNLANTGGTATGVSIQILDSDGSTPLNFVNGSTVQTSSFTKASSDTTASQDLTARYYAETASVTAGTVIASAQYSITYQ